jgi:hypothetical protein
MLVLDFQAPLRPMLVVLEDGEAHAISTELRY